MAFCWKCLFTSQCKGGNFLFTFEVVKTSFVLNVFRSGIRVNRGFFVIAWGHRAKRALVVGSQGAFQGPDAPPITMQYVYTAENVKKRRDMSLRPKPRWDKLPCKSHYSDMSLLHNWKGQNTGWALAVVKGLVGQVEGLVREIPQHFVW